MYDEILNEVQNALNHKFEEGYEEGKRTYKPRWYMLTERKPMDRRPILFHYHNCHLDKNMVTMGEYRMFQEQFLDYRLNQLTDEVSVIAWTEIPDYD